MGQEHARAIVWPADLLAGIHVLRHGHHLQHVLGADVADLVRCRRPGPAARRFPAPAHTPTQSDSELVFTVLSGVASVALTLVASLSLAELLDSLLQLTLFLSDKGKTVFADCAPAEAAGRPVVVARRSPPRRRRTGRRATSGAVVAAAARLRLRHTEDPAARLVSSIGAVGIGFQRCAPNCSLRAASSKHAAAARVPGAQARSMLTSASRLSRRRVTSRRGVQAANA